MTPKTLEPRFQILVLAVCDLAKELGKPELAEKLVSHLASIVNLHEDGRKTSWTPERKARFAEAMSTSWAAKRGETEAVIPPSKLVYYAFKFRDAPGELVGSYFEVAEHSKLALSTVRNKLNANKSGFVVRGRDVVIYATDPDAVYHLCNFEAEDSGDASKVIALPSKKSVGRRF